MKFKIYSNLFLFICIVVITTLNSCVKELKLLPQAEFTYSTTAACQLPMSVSFENLSQNANVYRWDFGDATLVSHSENPIHVYAAEGNYEVTLTSYGEGGTHETKLIIYAVTTPVTSFYTHDTLVDIGDSVHFFSTTHSSLPSTWLWSFGDGFTSTLENPAHLYSYPGTYSVVLTATNACGATYVIQNDYVVVNQAGALPIVNFNANVTTINTGNTINFTDLTQNNPTSWQWTFDGGIPASSNIKNPAGIGYKTPGAFMVKLIATNQSGSDSLTKLSYINVVSPGAAPVANFSANVTTITAGNSVSFTDLSINNPTSWTWQFLGGNPINSSTQNPIVMYPMPGTYNVTLTATNSFGSDVETKTMYITVNPPIITQVLIKKITVENMPFPTVPPMFVNPYYQITTQLNAVLKDGRADHLSSITNAMMPVFWNLTPYFVVPNFNTQFKIRLTDWRPNLANELSISEVMFNMINYVNPPNAFPQSIILQQNATKIILDLQWQ